jgi:predicted ester cyclase
MKSTNFLIVLSISVFLFLNFGCQKLSEDEIDEKDAQTILDAMAEIWNEGNLDLVDEFYAPDYVRRYVDTYEDMVGIEAYKKWISNNRTSLSGFRTSIEGDVITHADKIVIRWIAEGKTGGKKVRFRGVSIMRVSDRKIAEECLYFNRESLLRQRGFTITPPAPVSPEKK